ncbi:cytochrome b [Ehrlichia ruminantium]|nr:cytochrome b/b6 [Ehrlichia ruminantium]QLK50580.1 cytochrome b/b6 [Ehrlichia ruminantium]QLK51505.1 cytochrome b/b6 [Ehrlichia ruminantium]QLK55180.1 cytochrome b/b6 [Ehrlichia ruminantium]QLK56097.1 cytochrome b/b6 [Ehrlichia ruminantium]UOD98402.1 cytochrome b/b6 [Ehrlichia ruminantium]
MSGHNNMEKQEGSGILSWIEYRLPICAFLKGLASYQVPKNLNYAWNFGSLAGIALILQIITGIFLAMHYTPHVAHAFDSVERIMRDVNYGWLIRYTHAVGASFFFIVVYIHILRGLYYGSYKSPRELVWFVGIFIFFAMMATAFMGYVLPWGQMSFWGATVITNLFSVIPLVGDNVVQWLWGGFSVDNPTLNRFFALHYLLPFIILMLASLHVIALHRFGSGNPSGIEVKSSKDTIPIYPYFIVKDCITFGIFFLLLFLFVFYIPNYLGHPDNYIEADPMVTPAHIVPEWYFLPFYAMLRSIPNKLLGVVTMISSIAVWFLLPVLDRSKIKSGAYRPVFRIFYWLFIANFCLLTWLGGQEVKEPFVTFSRLSTLYYFSYFVIILPILSKYEKSVVLPNTLSDTVSEMK